MENFDFQKRDRHREATVQLKAWIPAPLRDEFASVCATQQTTAASVLRGLLSAYVQQVRK
ncbi:hypothetical protein CR159_20285 [Pollutimonas subterranea]|uniref:Uncharacterized protein n=1 Tax=Pollutimonas subterranea TaxID=2045210 RepID=A0A2N4TZ35_9BURK|nr:hypothetical protein CR159_20285 [Pollutimonas subterranea]